ncbi:MAG: rod shape-determining protein MreC [Helicobacteraceae bacterium]|jgi:rod shape-determining protein MreC|nr:rod shape-determining protein MreC [Helicobacteraceae bacterium]
MLRRALIVAAATLIVIAIFRFGFLGSALFTEVTGAVKSRYFSLVFAAEEWISTYFNQAEMIQRLAEENRQLKSNQETLGAFANEVIALSKLKGYDTPMGFKVKIVRAISYAQLPDMQKIVVDYSNLAASEVRGLIYNNQTAGIVIEPMGNYAKALLNGDTACSYSVYIGESKAPGIAMGKSDREMIVRYIPAWMNVNEGDEVVTNGLDGIFFAGVKVGTVTKVNRLNAYIEAIIKPYYVTFNPDYFYLVESTR